MTFPPVWYKVLGHPVLDDDTAYRAVSYVRHSESGWAYLVFISKAGHTVAVQVWRCTALIPTCESRSTAPFALFRPLTDTERGQAWAGKFKDPDLDRLEG